MSNVVMIWVLFLFICGGGVNELWESWKVGVRIYNVDFGVVGDFLVFLSDEFYLGFSFGDIRVFVVNRE